MRARAVWLPTVWVRRGGFYVVVGEFSDGVPAASLPVVVWGRFPNILMFCVDSAAILSPLAVGE